MEILYNIIIYNLENKEKYVEKFMKKQNYNRN